MPQKEFENLLLVDRFLKLESRKDKDLQEIVELAASICEAPLSMITFLNRETQIIKYSVGFPLIEIGYEDTFCKHTVEQYKVLEVTDTSKDSRFLSNPFVVNDPHIRFYAGAPLTTDDQLNLGTICVFDHSARKLNSLQINMLQSLSKQVMRIMEFDTSLQLLKDQYRDSKNAENTLHAFFESSSSCHLLLDLDLKVISYNKALADIVFAMYQLEFSLELEIENYIHTDFVEGFKASCISALKGKSSVEERHFEYEAGDSSWYITFDPARNPAGEIIGVSYNATNITDSVVEQERLLAHNESLEKIGHIQKNDLVECIDTVNVLMGKIIKKDTLKNLREIKLLETSVKELNKKSRKDTYDKD